MFLAPHQLEAFSDAGNENIVEPLKTEGLTMGEFSERVIANMDIVLERVCRTLPDGGRHEERKFIAGRMMDCARSGRATLGQLEIVARRALDDLSHKKSA